VYIVIVGGGKVGYHLTKSLMAEDQEVLVIEKSGVKAERIISELGGTALQGDGAEAATLESAGVARADVVAAVTGHDEDNLVIAQVAKHRFNVPRTVVRINNPRNEFIFSSLGIDATVSATQVILSIILQEIPEHPFVHLLTLQEGGIGFIQIQVTSASPVAGRAMRDVVLPEEAAIPLLLRDGKAIVVHGDTIIAPNDKLIAVASTATEPALRDNILGAE